ncbi:MAG: DUF6932 family protein [Saprospiraceae bacterium]
MPRFDEHGHLMPYSVVELTLPEFEAIFVDGLADQGHRRTLFEDYLRFVEEVKTAFDAPFYQWLAGSFITTKELPGDIDTVTFLPYDVVVKNAEQVNHFKSFGQDIYRVDANFSPVCKWNHRFYESAQMWETEYYDLYSRSRPDENFIRHPKGIIKISFGL